MRICRVITGPRCIGIYSDYNVISKSWASGKRLIRNRIVACSASKEICTCFAIHKSYNAPILYPTMHHSEHKCACICFEWCIVGYAKCIFCHFDEIFVISCTVSCQTDNFRCSRRSIFRRNDGVSFQCISRFGGPWWGGELLTKILRLRRNEFYVKICSKFHWVRLTWYIFNLSDQKLRLIILAPKRQWIS